MKKLVLILIGLITFANAYTQDITGQWNGVLKEMNLRLVVHITKTDDGYSSTLDSPDQGAAGIPANTTTFENDILKFEVSSLGLTYSGKFADETFNGTFSQGGFKIPLMLRREAIEKSKVNRPQEPKEPYPYYSEDVSFENPSADLTLAGTLTLPQKEGKFPVVVLISGSGPQDRNEELLGHKPFLTISDYLTRNGIGVLRFDDRGVGKSTGNFGVATSVDFASDVESAITYLKSRKEIDATKIGLVGHSEGGIIAPMVAAQSDDVSFIALLAGTGIRGDKLLLLQQELIGRTMGMSETQLRKSKELSTDIFDMIVNSGSQDLKTLITEYLTSEVNKLSDSEIPIGMSKDEASIKGQVDQLTTPWMIYFIKHDPASVLENVKCPVLALNGEKDLQVPPDENLTAIKRALEKGGNNEITTIEFENLNHLFQESTTGAPSEYGTIEQTFAPVALETISSWILKQVE